MDLTLDSNVLVYANIPPYHKDPKEFKRWEGLHKKSKQLFEDILRGKHNLIIPFSVLVEVASVISILTGKRDIAKDVAIQIEDASKLIIFDRDLMDVAIEHAIEIKAGGFDNIIATTSISYKTLLITNDKPFYEKIAKVSYLYDIDVKLLREMSIRVIKEL